MSVFLHEISATVIKLSRKKRILFCAINCEQLYPNYIAFQQQNGWGDHRVLRAALDSIYQYLIDDKLFSSDEFSMHLEQIDAVTPDTEDFSEILISFALDACTSIESTLEYIITNQFSHVVYTATYALDTVDRFVQLKDDLDPNQELLEEIISSDRFMQREKNRQKDLLLDISRLGGDKMTDQIINSFKCKEKIIDLDLLH